MATVLGLATVALLLSGLIGGRLLRSYLIDGIDDQLRAAAQPPNPRLGALTSSGIETSAAGTASAAALPNPYYVSRLDRRGQVQSELASYPVKGSSPTVRGLTLTAAAERAGEPFTTRSTSGPGTWRAVALPLSDGSGTLVIATSLDDVDASVTGMHRLNLLVGVVALAGLGLACYSIVRHALRPIEQLEHTASAIADGDLGRRLPVDDPQSEVGRSARAVNRLLDQVAAGLRTRDVADVEVQRSRDRMRQFVSDASHELRTPLTSIRGWAELYRQGTVTDLEAVPDLLHHIEQEATGMARLVDDLLLLARLDQGQALTTALVDLGAVVRDAVDSARIVAPERKVQLVSPLEPIVIGDESRLRHAVANLLDNALRHTPAGTPIDVSLMRVPGVDDSGDEARLEVRDYGPGLNQDQVSLVFERFYRTDAARSRGLGGAGLGLAIVAAIIEAHEGRAEVESFPGDGAVFRLLLPLPQAHP
jgi:two-component system OmpR family sensor kinase